MSTSDESTSLPITAERITDQRRMECLPKHFGLLMLAFENRVYGFMRDFATNYRGGYWHFYELSNGGFYMAPEAEPLHIQVPTNGFEGTLSADAAGIAVCLFACSHLSFDCQDPSGSELFARHFHRLREYALEHAEVQQIIAMID